MPRRYTQQQQQEDISINQFRERMYDFGWLVERMERDNGNGLIVRIITGSQPVGVPFYVQLISVTDLADRRTNDYVRYSLDVEVLKRWETSVSPVVVCIWDIKLRGGRWETAKALAGYLDQVRPGWRSQKTVTVYVPWTHTTDDTGLRELKAAIGHLIYPIIAKGRDLSVRFNVSISDTDENVDARKELDKHVREGQPISISGAHIHDLEFSEWFTEWFVDPEFKIHEIEISQPTQSEPILASITLVERGTGTASFHNIDFRIIRRGTDLIELSNAGQNAPMTFNVILSKREDQPGESNLKFRVNTLGDNMYETRNIVRFLQGIEAGGSISINFAALANRPVRMSIEPTKKVEHRDTIDSWIMDMVESLCIVQDKLGRVISLPDQGFSQDDAERAKELKEIVSTGRTIRSYEKLSVTATGLEPFGNLVAYIRDNGVSAIPLGFVANSEDSHVELFSDEYHVGPMTRIITGILDTPVEAIEKHVQNNDESEPFTYTLVDAEVVEEFSDWIQHEPTRILVLTEGQTDWKHMKAAYQRLKEKGQLSELELEFREDEQDVGDGELLNTCRILSRLPQPVTTVPIFDRDAPATLRQIVDGGQDFKFWGNGVYSVALPVPLHRAQTPEISIEFYYSDEEIQREDEHGRRLFIGTEFSGRTSHHHSGRFSCNDRNKVGKFTIIDNAVFTIPSESGENVALSKNAFATYVVERRPGFDDFDISSFEQLFELLEQIGVAERARQHPYHGLARMSPI